MSVPLRAPAVELGRLDGLCTGTAAPADWPCCRPPETENISKLARHLRPTNEAQRVELPAARASPCRPSPVFPHPHQPRQRRGSPKTGLGVGRGRGTRSAGAHTRPRPPAETGSVSKYIHMQIPRSILDRDSGSRVSTSGRPGGPPPCLPLSRSGENASCLCSDSSARETAHGGD